MIVIWYRHHGQRPSKTDIITEDANSASVFPQPFEVVGVQYGRRLSQDEFDSNQFALRVAPPSDNISQNAIDNIAIAFEDNWGGAIDFVESVQD